MSAPLTASLLTAAGIMPFVALSKPLQKHFDANALIKQSGIPIILGRPSLNYRELQVTYGSVILSFVGAPHWGLALSQPNAGNRVNILRLVWGVIPSLIAWPCASMPSPRSQDVLASGLASAFFVDALFAKAKLLPSGYLMMRFPPTLAGVVMLQMTKTKS
ncbi:hypothetical protein TL16_g06728 [Triparma laevis f. inornata]|uniref:Uncharacterized protein n=2 Tax=Triparma laevis TaxID=1534972 RepID=A0A9W7EI56_9STRA|nr:hypothetical protein TL16_g06728 [Triparma laevis f. inornata]GMH79818.1 hypothetical protein TrLO_g13490 [Triparma laevis f. longispina]